MTGSAQLDLAEDVAAVTFAMFEVLTSRDCSTDGGSRYDVFEGFPGFCDHAGAAGLALHRAFRDDDCDQWIDIVVDFAGAVVRRALDRGKPADAPTLLRIAEAVRKQADRDGLIGRREVRS